MEIKVYYQSGKGMIQIRYNRSREISAEATPKNWRVALKTGVFDPIHPMHIILGLETIKQGFADQVLYLPAEASNRKPNATPFEVRLEQVTSVLALFEPLLQVSDVKRGRKNHEVIEMLRNANPEFVQLNWIASEWGQSSRRMLMKLKSGCSLESVLNAEFTSHIAKYLYFYYEDTEFVKMVKDAGCERIILVKFAEQYLPFRNFHSTLIREKRASCDFVKVSDGVDFIFTFPENFGR